jgi:hypothetical protein
MSLTAREFYSGSNGDRWFVLHESDSGTVLINHRPNAASGGRPLSYPSWRIPVPNDLLP